MLVARTPFWQLCTQNNTIPKCCFTGAKNLISNYSISITWVSECTLQHAGSDFLFFFCLFNLAYVGICHQAPNIKHVTAAGQMFASATGSRVCKVSECHSCDRLISGCCEKHQLSPLRAIGLSTLADVAVHLASCASSTSLLLRRTAKFCPDRKRLSTFTSPCLHFRHLQQIWTSVSQFMSAFMVCVCL